MFANRCLYTQMPLPGSVRRNCSLNLAEGQRRMFFLVFLLLNWSTGASFGIKLVCRSLLNYYNVFAQKIWPMGAFSARSDLAGETSYPKQILRASRVRTLISRKRKRGRQRQVVLWVREMKTLKPPARFLPYFWY